ncbi:protein Skeletor, isoforms B/C isoform X1 [Leptopilina heterotoma]|uniref:protein Skeletor, isoforms B/C isoform X1 n=1 Tax=Leptopilina heterotoma TaxID=63436 RepID=UPI001CA8DBB8|nr:protein Skeletor, isoforms B/C isoform X1 [Leptopilina heterotoma]XP_043479494.1 protein Skeletor, isoforms B/C isoform X1 [Leptopilina heterotoma]
MTRSSPPSIRCCSLGLVIALFLVFVAQICNAAYYGKQLGRLSELHHGVSGEIYAVDGRTLFIKGFNYDGEGPAAFFYAGSSKSPGNNGFRVRDERGTTNVLKRYRNKDITLTLPEGKTLNNIKWFSVYCDEFAVNFGDIKIPRSFDYPKPQKLGSLSGIHGVSSEPVVIVDAQTLLIPSFSYDGEAPDAKFWTGAGPHPSPQGIKVPDENGKIQPLRRYDHKTVVLTLPGDLTVHQLGHFGVWCEAFAVDFGHVQIPQSLNVPPSLKMLGVSPQSKLNCEVLEDSLAFEVRWAVAGDSIVIQLVGKLEDGQYMSFGLSGEAEKSVMIGGDVVVAWVDKQTLQGYAIDYFLNAKSQCSGGRGSCPDTRIQDNTNSVRLLNAAMVNGYSIVTYQRPLKANDELDRQIKTNGSQAIIWGVGPLNERNEVSFHSDYLKTDQFIEFGRPPVWNCPMPDQEPSRTYGDSVDKSPSNQELTAVTRIRQPATPAPAPKTDAWVIPDIQCNEPEDGVFYAQMGPTGGKHGYPAITGHVGWGISWYINGLLIPVIHVVRGKKYNFVVEGGDDADIPARYHPFYITDDPVGGYLHKTPEERAKVKIFAGVRRQRGTVRPTGVGRFCNWVPDQNSPLADDFASFGAYQRILSLICDPGEPGIVQWTPDENTPDTVYYQCFTHRYLGWKIQVHDSCDLNQAGAASEIRETYAELEAEPEMEGDLKGGASIRVSSKVTPAPEFFKEHQEYGQAYGHRHFSHHSATNPSNLGSHIKQLTRTHVPYDHHRDTYERLQLPSYTNLKSTFNPSSAMNMPHSKDIRIHTLAYPRLKEESSFPTPHQSPIEPIIPPVFSHSPHPIMEPEQEVLSSNQQSKLIPDSKPGTFMSFGPVKYSYPLQEAPPQTILFTRTPQHIFHQPPRPQLMILRRAPQPRRPMPSPMITMNNPMMSRPPVFIERKKSVYRTPIVKSQQPPHQVTKLIKIDNKQQRAKLEPKVSEIEPSETISHLAPMKPARNTGFNPDSIVIEGGFKPILKSIESIQDREIPQFRSVDNFEPMFIPTALDRDGKKNKKKTQNYPKVRLDDLDDMEMAADRLDSYYLPSNSKNDETVITFDGKRVKDSSLARSIPKSVERPKKKSDLLTRTPQFGRFRGDLPPIISPDVRNDELERRRITSKEISVPELTSITHNNHRAGNTKLTLIERAKRSAAHEERNNSSHGVNHDRNGHTYDHTGYVQDHEEYIHHSEFEHNHSNHDHSNHDHSNHDHNNHSDHDKHSHDHNDGGLTLASTGQVIIANIEYIVLTAILYYII